VLLDGQPAAYLERGAKTLVTFGNDAGEPTGAWADALAALVKDGMIRRIELRTIDGEPPADHPAASALRVAGFTDGYRGLTLRG
jgi:ATP-dependent Lhr-like helicase